MRHVALLIALLLPGPLAAQVVHDAFNADRIPAHYPYDDAVSNYFLYTPTTSFWLSAIEAGYAEGQCEMGPVRRIGVFDYFSSRNAEEFGQAYWRYTIHNPNGPDYWADHRIDPIFLDAGNTYYLRFEQPIRRLMPITEDPAADTMPWCRATPFFDECGPGAPVFRFVGPTPDQVVPEPLSLLPLGTGLAGIGAARRRRSRS
jgi:hypothetical protein